MTSEGSSLDSRKGSNAEPAWASDPNARRAERYVLGPELGRGGMGRVHLGWDPMLRRMVAIKLLLGDDPELHLRLLREARSQAKVEHANVCRIHDLGMEGDRPYIAMQLILGISLAELRPELDRRNMVELMADVASAVHAAHKVGLIHRDLKPANILVTGRNLERQKGDKAKALLDSGGIPVVGRLKPYVVDFGLARDLQAHDQTLSWAVMGTPAFMSPEQARGEALGPATDIYSLGATLYAMLTGKPPYEGTTLAGLITQQSERGVRAIRRLGAAVPKDLETITLKCLESEPARRYASAQALEEDLRRWLAGRPIEARPVGPVGRLWRWSRRKPTLAATAAAGILATLVLGGWNLHTSRQARVREAAAQRFALEIRDAEHLLRIERMMPIHDIRPAEARLRARMVEIRAEMEKLGGIARGPGLYAIGRGHLALREFQEAIRELDAAWGSGFQAPEVAYARALARLRSFESRVMNSWLGIAHPEVAAQARNELVVPAVQLLRDAPGARVDNPDYGYALAAMASERFEEAEQSFRQAIEQAPWLAEAWTARAQSTVLWKWKAQMTPEQINELCREIEPMIAAAERLAPSDEAPLLVHVQFNHSRYIRVSARQDRSEKPLAEAMELLGMARRIRPDLPNLEAQSAEIAIQRGFFQLSSGQDPAPLLAAAIRSVEASLGRSGWLREEDRSNARLGLHHLWWLAGEANWRFGRDPRPELANAAAIRPLFPSADLHFVFPTLVLARYRIGRGEDPTPQFQEAEGILKRIPNQRDTFLRSIVGELSLEWAQWLHAQGRDAEGRIKPAIEALEASAREDPAFAYTFYFLAPLHALRARVALGQGRDGSSQVRAALAAARRGLRANPRNVQIRLAAAEALLAEAEVRQHQQEDPTPSLEEARRQLAAGEAEALRDFRLALARARLEWAAAEAMAGRGEDPGAPLARLASACRKGLAVKGDEPRFHLLLARGAALRAGRRLQAGAEAEARREAARALALCPGNREAVALLAQLGATSH